MALIVSLVMVRFVPAAPLPGDGGTLLFEGKEIGDAEGAAEFGNVLLSFDVRKPADGWGDAALVLGNGHRIGLKEWWGDGGKADEWTRAEIAFSESAEAGLLLEGTLGGEPFQGQAGEHPPRVDSSGERKSGKAWWMSSEEDGRTKFGMGGDFTIAVGFRTKGNGTLVSKCPPMGKWVPDAKALYFSDGRLVYDIGWIGAIRSKSPVNDGKWHHAVLVVQGKKATLHVDGKLEAEKGDFNPSDPAGHVLKIGDANNDFGGAYDGEIEYVRFWERSLPKEEVKALGDGKAEATNTPILNWMPEAAPRSGGTGASVAEGGTAKTALRFLSGRSGVKFAKVMVSPLAEVDHARVIREWDEAALARGARVYNGYCITCHGSREIEGSLPTAPRFFRDPLKNGNDPYHMYRTLTDGFNTMVPQPWMTPRQKYDVIHYIRETFLDAPPAVDAAYLASLPRGLGVGPLKPQMFGDDEQPKWKKMDFGPVLFWTLEAEEGNIAYKGIAVRLDEGAGGISKGNTWMLYDHDTLRVAAAWTGQEFVNWRGIAFDQSHQTHTAIVGDSILANPVGPGWGRPGDASFEEVRLLGRDGKPYGPLPREWAQYRGLFLHGNRAVIHYTVGDADVLEMPGYENVAGATVFSRTLNIGKATRDLVMRVAGKDASAAVVGPESAEIGLDENDAYVLRVPASATPLKVKVLFGDVEAGVLEEYAAKTSGPAIDLEPLTKGGLARWPEVVETDGKTGPDEGPFAVDEVTLPVANPWESWMRLGGFDFFPDGQRAAVATWLGDVWIVDGIDGVFGKHHWRRIASGLFQPLGVRIVDDTIYVTCRDQIARLHDLNGDGEIDHIECFNNDHQVTEHFHEFAMGLQTDAEGNFYYAKSARHALPAVVPHHGTLLRVSKDGTKTDILATGFRAANGVCLNPDGTYIVTDQEGHWNPKNRINYVREGGFYGNMYGYHNVTDESDSAMEQPLCWITNAFDRSPGELLWVPENAAWGPLNGHLLNLSYGMGRIFLVPHEKLPDGQAQGGMVSLGLDFPTGVMRGRFHPGNGQLYAAGMFAWAGNKSGDGGFYRVRATGKPANLPIGLKARKDGVLLEFSDPLDPESAGDVGNYAVKTWALKRTKNYGSPHIDEKPSTVASVKVGEDGKSVFLMMPGIAPTWCMEIRYTVLDVGGQKVEGVIDNTIHALR
jgi:mono/diheme cytochrome c family protein